MSRSVEPSLHYVTCVNPAGAHRMAYWQWGDPNNDKVLLCVHGLTRSGRDFDPVARRLAQKYKVICPDIVGRGKSDWLSNPGFYAIPQYVADIFTLIARLNPQSIDWIGTSMGGLIGLGLCYAVNVAAKLNPPSISHGLADDRLLPINKMVLNDIGPVINNHGLGRIAEYVGQDISFDSFDQAVQYIREVSADFGEHSDADWQELTRNVMVNINNKWHKHYDLKIAIPMAQESSTAVKGAEQILWPAYDSLSDKVLIIRGEHSDLLLEQTVSQMLKRNSNASLYTVKNTGHAPTLRNDEQISTIESFLEN